MIVLGKKLMGPIVCATDCSNNAAAALKMANTLSEKLDSRLLVLHVFDLNVALLTPLSMTYAKMEKEAFEENRKKLVDFYKKHLGQIKDGTKLQLMVRENAMVNDAIIDVVTEFDASLVIMGTKGSNAFRNLVMGSNAKKMIQESPCPFLMVPPTTDKFSIEQIAYASDFEDTDIHAIDWLIKTMAGPDQAFVKIIHVSTLDWEKGEEQMRCFQKKLRHKVKYEKLGFELIYSDNVSSALEQCAKRREMDVLVMLERNNKSVLSPFAHKDFVKQMMSKTQLPLLSLNKNLFH
ncbi:UspA domain-containing protein [Allomuricauda ruestringensis DSM 13258]|uniref:UspA domain-containing protein n=2 Tax=Flagellimonas TaxID=444459 RepID=G2PRN5_ALLRU|nr:UspA domain-containing protein [Allomuricauda ruestringensis DSM 13258]